jgi:hypothetical protein
MAYDKNAYNNQYKKDKFDHFGFYAPKGTKEKVEARAQELGMKLAEYFRYLIEKDTE